MSQHARLSPSSAHRWIPCPGSLTLEESLPKKDDDNEYSREGTAAHELAAWALKDTAHCCEEYIGKTTSNGSVITQDMADDTQIYVDTILDYALANTLFVEQRVDFSDVIGVPNSFGTSDAVILTADDKEIIVCDLKFGRGVEVFADENEQLMLYALGALREFGMMGNFERVRLVISQPRIGNLSEWDCTVEELYEFGERAKESALRAINPMYTLSPTKKILSCKETDLHPGEKQCRFCKAKAICPALAKKIKSHIGMDFEDITQVEDIKDVIPSDTETLSIKMKAIDLIETFCKAVRAEVEKVLLSGGKVPGYKLVQGRMGSRKWGDEAAAEEALKSMRLKIDQMYDMKIISPTNAEKLLAKEKPRKWKKLQDLIIRTEGVPSVAPEKDKRPAIEIKPTSDDFSDLTN